MPQNRGKKISTIKNCHKKMAMFLFAIKILQISTRDMNKLKDIRKQLNLSQIDLAILLKTTRTQLSMFELGLRDLPTKSNIILADIMQFLHQEKVNPEKNLTFQKEEALQTKKALEESLENNTYQQLLLDRKLKVAEEKYRNALTAASLANHLEKKNDENDKLSNGMYRIIRNDAKSNLKKTNQTLLTQYQIKKEVLQAEEKILLKHLKKLS